jgi:hypothetical protein
LVRLSFVIETSPVALSDDGAVAVEGATQAVVLCWLGGAGYEWHPSVSEQCCAPQSVVCRSVATERAEERAEVCGEEAGFFEREEVAAAGGACPLADVGVAAFGVLAGIVAVFGGQGDPGGNVDTG